MEKIRNVIKKLFIVSLLIWGYFLIKIDIIGMISSIITIWVLIFILILIDNKNEQTNKEG